nr:head maturation protease, ClpP-related [Alkalibacter mobilis]
MSANPDLGEPAQKPFFQFNRVNDQKTEINIYGDITSWRWIESDVSAYSFKKQLNEVETPEIEVRIDSYGGEVAEGLAIYNILKSSDKEVTTIVDGFACSIASIIFMAGKKRIMNTGTLLMWHNPWLYTAGNADELEKAAADLRKMADSSVAIYKAGSNLDEDVIREMMKSETWISAEEAINMGIATETSQVDGAKQSMEARTLYSTIMKLKSVEDELMQIKEKETIPVNAWDQFFRG